MTYSIVLLCCGAFEGGGCDIMLAGGTFRVVTWVGLLMLVFLVNVAYNFCGLM